MIAYKEETEQFASLRGGLCMKEGGSVFEGGLIPQCTLTLLSGQIHQNQGTSNKPNWVVQAITWRQMAKLFYDVADFKLSITKIEHDY